jgi:hypothetical protein
MRWNARAKSQLINSLRNFRLQSSPGAANHGLAASGTEPFVSGQKYYPLRCIGNFQNGSRRSPPPL